MSMRITKPEVWDVTPNDNFYIKLASIVFVLYHGGMEESM